MPTGHDPKHASSDSTSAGDVFSDIEIDYSLADESAGISPSLQSLLPLGAGDFIDDPLGIEEYFANTECFYLAVPLGLELFDAQTRMLLSHCRFSKSNPKLKSR